VKVLVTGGAGFIGRWLLRTLPGDAEVVVVDSLVADVHGPAAVFPAEVRARAQCTQCDVGDVDAWRHAAAGVDVVVHLAALTGTGQGMYQQRRYVEHNVLATDRLCAAIAAMRPQPFRVILASSRAVYGEGAYRAGGALVYPGPRQAFRLAAGLWDFEDASGEPMQPVAATADTRTQPVSIYGMTKARQEEAVRALAAAHGIDTLVLRLQNVYGPLQSAINPHTGIVGGFASGLVRDRRVELYEDGEMTRDFVYVEDVARAVLAGIGHRHRLDCAVDVGSGERTPLRRLVGLLAEALSVSPDVHCRGRYREGDVRHAAADMTACHRLVGTTRHVALADGLRRFVAWRREQPDGGGGAARALVELQQHGVLRERQAGA
jgi:dTDP-L-rhamnose 4-epimerase